MDIPQVGDQARKAPAQAIRAVFAGIGRILLAADRPQAGQRPAGPKHAAPGGRAPQAAAPGGRTTQSAAPAGRAPKATVPGRRAPQVSAPQAGAPGGRVTQATVPGRRASHASAPQAGARGGGAPQAVAAGRRAPQTPAPPTAAPPTAAPPTAAPPAVTEPADTEAAATASQRWRSLDETGNVRLLSTEELTVGHGTVVAAPVPGSLDGEGQAEAEEAINAPVSSQPLTGNVPIGAGFVVHELPLPGYDTLPIASIRARLRSLDVDQLQALLVHEHKNAKRPDVIAMIDRRIEKLENGG